MVGNILLVKSMGNSKNFWWRGKHFRDCFVFTIVERIMKILRMLKTLITAKGMQVLLLGKEVTMPDGASLGVIVGIKRELAQDKIWMVVDKQGQEVVIPIEQIASVTDKVVLFGDLPLVSLAANENRI